MAGRLDPDALLDAMAHHVLAHGLAGASLRPLAKAAGTSDRMLIYHFGSKEGLVGALLDRLASMVTRGLATALPPEPAASREALLEALLRLLRQPAMRAFSPVWFEMVAEAARGTPVYRQATARILDGFAAFIEERLPVTERSAEAATALLTLVEGAVLMDAAGRSEAMDAMVASLAGPAGDP